MIIEMSDLNPDPLIASPWGEAGKFSPYGMWGKYENFENLMAANDFANFHNNTPLDITIEHDYSKGRYGEAPLREHREAEVMYDIREIEPPVITEWEETIGNYEIEQVVRHEGKFSRWLEECDFYDNVSRNIEIKDPGIMVPVDGRVSEQQPNTALTAYDSIFNCRINDVGKMLSRSENFRQTLANYLQSEEGQELMAELEVEEYKTPSLDSLAVGLTPKDALIAIYSGENTVMARNLDFYNQIAKEAAFYGISVAEYLKANPDLAEELAERATLAEEITHMFRGTEPDGLNAMIEDELETKEFVRKFYERKRNGSGKHEARDYANLEEIMAEDIETTPGRYSDLYSSAAKAGHSRSKVNSLIAKYLAEAEEEGYEGKEAVAYAVSKAKAEVSDKEEADKEDADDPEEEQDEEIEEDISDEASE